VYSRHAVDGGGSSGASPGNAGTGASDQPARDPRPLVEEPPPPVDVPDAATAEQIARDLLERSGALGDAQWETEVYDSGSVAIACAEGVPCPTIPSPVTERTVSFTMIVDGVPVQGGGWSVTVGEHRRVNAVDGEWADPQLVDRYPLQPTNAAFDDLRNGKAHPIGGVALAAEPAIGAPDSATPVEVRVTGATLGIARWDAIDNEQSVAYLVPTYRFHTDGDGGDIEVLALDPALVDFIEPADVKPLPPDGIEPAPAEPPQATPEPAPANKPATEPAPAYAPRG
jgi:hypothetical protein